MIREESFFDPSLRDVGDAEWTVRGIKAGLPMAVMGEFTSSFTDTGNNMNLRANAVREKQQFFKQVPLWAQKLKPLIVAHYRLRRGWAGYYHCRPHEYAIYTEESPTQRKVFQVDKPTYRWAGHGQ